jgi:hypothetical protein
VGKGRGANGCSGLKLEDLSISRLAAAGHTVLRGDEGDVRSLRALTSEGSDSTEVMAVYHHMVRLWGCLLTLSVKEVPR